MAKFSHHIAHDEHGFPVTCRSCNMAGRLHVYTYMQARLLSFADLHIIPSCTTFPFLIELVQEGLHEVMPLLRNLAARI